MNILCTLFRVIKEIIFNAGNGPPSVKIVFHKYRGSLSEAPHDVNINTVSNLHSRFDYNKLHPKKSTQILLSSLFAHISNGVSGRNISFRLCMDFKGKA